jgi:type IV secretory pathway TrbL component
MGKLEVIIREVIEKAPQGSRTRKKALSELKALQRLREEEANVAMRDESHMEEVTRNVRKAAVSARAAAAEWVSALKDQADYAASVEAGGRLPPQEVAVDMEETAGSQAQPEAARQLQGMHHGSQWKRRRRIWS